MCHAVSSKSALQKQTHFLMCHVAKISVLLNIFCCVMLRHRNQRSLKKTSELGPCLKRQLSTLLQVFPVSLLPLQVAKPDADAEDHAGVSHSSGQQYAPAPHQRFSSAPSVANGLPPKKFRPHGSADSRHSSSYRQQLRQLQVRVSAGRCRARGVSPDPGLPAPDPLSSGVVQWPTVYGPVWSSGRLPLVRCGPVADSL